MNLIKCKENVESVNLDNVCYIYPSISPDTSKRPHKIFFMFSAMNSEECMECIWVFGDIESFNRVLGSIQVLEV